MTARASNTSPRRSRPATNGHLDRLPPHLPEAEMGVLGCVMIFPKTSMVRCMENLETEDFYDMRHQEIYKGFLYMIESNIPIDTISLLGYFKAKNMVEQVGGIAYLMSLLDAVPSAANLSYYIESVVDRSLLRKMIHACTDSVARIYEGTNETNVLMDEIERAVLAVRKSCANNKTVPIKELVKEAISIIETMHEGQGSVTGIPTGYADLDKLTNGLHPGDTTIIAALPSVGKTSLAMNIAEHVILDLKLPVGVFSLEMSAISLVLRMLSSRARVNLRSAPFLERDFPALTAAAGKLASSLLYIEDISDMSVATFRAKARRMVQEHGVKLLVVDYLQLLSGYGSGRKIDSRADEIEVISNGVKACAKENKVPILVLSQLTEGGKGEAPKLRGSRSIGMDADGVWMLEPDSGSETEVSVSVKLWIRKQRNGPRNVAVDLTFLKGYTRFESAAKISDNDI